MEGRVPAYPVCCYGNGKHRPNRNKPLRVSIAEAFNQWAEELKVVDWTVGAVHGAHLLLSNRFTDRWDMIADFTTTYTLA